MLPPFKPLDHLDENTACARGARTLVGVCAGVRAGERVLILSNPATCAVADYVAAECCVRTAAVQRLVIEPLSIHGATPPARVGAAMLWADVVFCLTSMSMAHTSERKRANEKGTRILSLPDYSLALLASKSLCCDFHQAANEAKHWQQLLHDAKKIRVQTRLGTDLTFSAEGRRANACPGLCLKPGTLGSPPDAEVNIAPLEGTAAGVVHVDGSIPCQELGKLVETIVLEIQAGRIVGIHGNDTTAVATLERLFQRVGKPQARWLAEFGIGLNPLAELTGCMPEDEGCAGTIHLGFGSKATIGGINDVPFHLDFVVRDPTVTIDGQSFTLSRQACAPRKRAG